MGERWRSRRARQGRDRLSRRRSTPIGLDPSDYPTPDFKSATTADAQAEAELKLTASVLTYARQAQIGRIHFSRVGADIEFKPVAPEPADVLAKLAEASDVAAALDGYNPPQPEFKALKEKLAELRKGALTPKAEEEKKPDLVRIGDGKTLHVGMKDPRVVAAAQAARHRRRQGPARSTTTPCATR